MLRSLSLAIIRVPFKHNITVIGRMFIDALTDPTINTKFSGISVYWRCSGLLIYCSYVNQPDTLDSRLRVK